MNKIRIAFLKEKTDAECRELAGHYYRRARRAEKERDQLRAECEKLRTAMIEAKSYIDHYMYGGSSYRKPAAEAIALIDAALQTAEQQPAPDVGGLLNRIIPRIDAGGPNPIDPDIHCCEWTLHRERERIHAEFADALAAHRKQGNKK